MEQTIKHHLSTWIKDSLISMNKYSPVIIFRFNNVNGERDQIVFNQKNLDLSDRRIEKYCIDIGNVKPSSNASEEHYYCKNLDEAFEIAEFIAKNYKSDSRLSSTDVLDLPDDYLVEYDDNIFSHISEEY